MNFLILAAVTGIAVPALAAPIAPIDAKAHIGEAVTVEGIASVHTIASGTTFIDMGGKGRSARFTGVIFKNNAASFPNIASYDGKTLDVTGTIKLYRGAAQIVLHSPSQISEK